jgi:sulfur carrier protein
MSEISIVVNGQPRNIGAGATVKDLIVAMGLGTRAIAVERNLEVVPKARHAETALHDGDRLELVTFVGGG